MLLFVDLIICLKYGLEENIPKRSDTNIVTVKPEKKKIMFSNVNTSFDEFGTDFEPNPSNEIKTKSILKSPDAFNSTKKRFAEESHF